MSDSERVASSFRDPSGFVFVRSGEIFRQINPVYRDDYDHLMESGLYEALVDSGQLLAHTELDAELADFEGAYKVVKPEQVPFISYPHEWSFSQLKDAALATLAIQAAALEHGMTLKDSSAYNIQFVEGRPVLIDTLSFETYREGQPWVAYRQFCQHFLAPLALMSYRDVRLSQLFRIYLDGIPLDLACSLLPVRTRFRFSLLCHLHLHARGQKHYANKPIDAKHRTMSRFAFRGLMDSLASAVRRLKWAPGGTEWGEYYSDTNYSEAAFEAKKELVGHFLDEAAPKNVWDMGANTGEFSRIGAERGVPTVAFDIDPAAVERNYLRVREQKETHLLPLVLDLTNPSPGMGWANAERMSINERGPADTVLALALVHHLAISNNLPFGIIARYFHSICGSLIVEFVPKNDSKVQRLLATREDIFVDYTQEVFEKEFSQCFTIQKSAEISESERTLYLMKTR